MFAEGSMWFHFLGRKEAIPSWKLLGMQVEGHLRLMMRLCIELLHESMLPIQIIFSIDCVLRSILPSAGLKYVQGQLKE